MESVLLFSGGFDSMLLEWRVNPDKLLYVNMGTVYAQREIESLQKLPERYKRKLIIKDLPLTEFEHADSCIPYRNLLLITVALQYAPKVYMGLTGQDVYADCSDTFLNKVRSLFRYLNTDVEHTPFRDSKFRIEVPFNGCTKTTMVEECLKNGMPKELIQGIRTCYSGHSHKGCGTCLPCWNKAVALLNNDIYDDALFDQPISEQMFEDSLAYYEEKWGSQKVNFLHYQDVYNAYKKLQSFRK